MARPKKYIVSLTDAEREQLTSITKNYRYSERERNRARILLLVEQGQTDTQVAEQVGCAWMTVRNVRLRFCQASEASEASESSGKQGFSEGSVKGSVKHKIKRAEQKNRAPRAFDGEKEAHLVALVCSTPPPGAQRWTLQLLHDRLIEMQIVHSVGKETIRRTLKKTNLSPGSPG